MGIVRRTSTCNALARILAVVTLGLVSMAMGTEAMADPGDVMTKFDVKTYGFHFNNTFKNVFIDTPVATITTSGDCGGMSFSALDYFNAGMPAPNQIYTPARGSKLESYIYQRQLDSMYQNADRWIEFGFNPFGWRNTEFFNWGLQGQPGGRIDELRRSIDAGKPVVIGLQNCGNCGNNLASHQVLAVGYNMGRYKGDMGDYQDEFRIIVYDNNAHDHLRRLAPDLGAHQWYMVDNPGDRWQAYFVDSKYKPSAPPVITTTPSQLILTFGTGGDDLRGGNDNVNVTVYFKNGKTLSVPNANEGQRWVDHSSQSIGIALPDETRFGDVTGIDLDTTFSGGVGGDNWNLDSLQAGMLFGNHKALRLNVSDTPYKRFTGSDGHLHLDFSKKDDDFSRPALSLQGQVNGISIPYISTSQIGVPQGQSFGIQGRYVHLDPYDFPLSWTEPATQDFNLTKIRGVTSGNPILVDRKPGDHANSFSAKVLPNSIYSIQVQNCNDWGCTEWSNSVSALSGMKGSGFLAFVLKAGASEFVVSAATPDSAGNFNATATVGNNIPPGPYRLLARAGGEVVASTPIEVLAPGVSHTLLYFVNPITKKLQTSAQIIAGSAVTLQGDGFPIGDVKFSLDSVNGPLLYFTRSQGPANSFQVTFPITAVGQHKVVASQVISGQTKTAAVDLYSEQLE